MKIGGSAADKIKAPETKPGCDTVESITLWELRQANLARNDLIFHKLEAWSPTDWGCALAGEVGELCNFLKKLKREQGKPLTRESLDRIRQLQLAAAKEIADVLIYLDLLAARIGVQLDTATVEKFNEVSKKYSSDIFLDLRDIVTPDASLAAFGIRRIEQGPLATNFL